MDGTVEGHSGYQAMKGEKWLPPVDPAQSEKAKQAGISATGEADLKMRLPTELIG